jgi:hypothetical protein
VPSLALTDTRMPTGTLLNDPSATPSTSVDPGKLRLWMMVGMGEARRRRPQRRLRQRKLFRREMEDTATRMALSTRKSGSRWKLSRLVSGSGAARRTLVLKVTRGLRDGVKFELQRRGDLGAQPNSQEYRPGRLPHFSIEGRTESE